MKANEAPEKVYFHGSYLDFKFNPFCSTNIEYVMKDAFIEKACEWLKEHREAVETEDNGIMGWIPDYFIEDFRKTLEEDSV